MPCLTSQLMKYQNNILANNFSQMSDHYKSPPLVLKEVSDLMKKQGKEAVLFGSKYRDERELYIGSVFSLGISCRMGRYNWIRKTEEDPPDAELMYLENTPDGYICNIAELEIVEFQKYSQKDLLETLKSKLQKNYPERYLLLCFIHSRKEIVYPLELSKEIKSLNPRLTAIYIMADCEIGNKNGGRQMVLTQIFPNLERINFDITQMAKSWPDDMKHKIKLTRGK